VKLLLLPIPFVMLAAILAGVLYLCGDRVIAQDDGRQLTLHGYMWGPLREEADPINDRHFFTDPIGDSETIEILALPQGFVAQWLKGTEKSEVEITIRVLPHGTHTQGH
jgi:hypothetical protein